MINYPRDFFGGWTPKPFLRDNLLINGDFRITQRTLTAVGPAGYLTVDRWSFPQDNNDLTVGSQDGSRFLQMARTGAGNKLSARQAVEIYSDSVYFPFTVGATLTLSFNISCQVAGAYPVVKVDWADDSLLTDSVSIVPQTALAAIPDTSGLHQYEYTFTINSAPAAGNLALVVEVGATAASIPAGQIVKLQNVKLEVGDKATLFQPRPYGEELALCQRYYWASPGAILWAAQNGGSTQYIVIPYAVQMRTSPTLTWSAFSDVDSSGLTISSLTRSAYGIRSVSMSGGCTIGERYTFQIQADAEL